MTAISLFLVASSSEAAQPRKIVGWTLDPYFAELGAGRNSPDVSHDFYPKDENASSWTERILLRTREYPARTTPAGVLDSLASEFRQECPELSENRMPVHGDDVASIGLVLWHCPKNSKTGRGQVVAQKVLLRGTRAYVMTAEGNYVAFAAGKTPFTPQQLSRWAGTQNSFGFCDDLASFGCMPDATAIMTAKEARLTPEQQQVVSLAEARGRELYQQDQLAWHATDYLADHGGLKQSKEGGFVALPGVGRTGNVYFVQRKGSNVQAVTQVEFDPAGVPFREITLQALPDDVAPLEAALRSAKLAKPSICNASINSAVLPAEDGNGWWVYVLTATNEPNLMYLGGHTRFRVGRDGRIVSQEPSARSCLALKTEEKGPDGQAATLIATHLVSDVPWETHVFQSLTFNKPLIVVTQSHVWRVENGKISLLDV